MLDTEGAQKLLSKEAIYDRIASQLGVPRSSSPPPVVRVIMYFVLASKCMFPRMNSNSKSSRVYLPSARIIYVLNATELCA